MGAQVPFTFTDGLQLWLDAGQGVTDSNGRVSAWADQSGNGNDLASRPGMEPTLAPSVPELGGLPAIQFKGTGGEPVAGNEDYLFGSINNSFDPEQQTWFIVGQVDELPASGVMLHSWNLGFDEGRAGVQFSRGGQAGFFAAQWDVIPTGPVDLAKRAQTEDIPLDDQFHVMAVQFDKTTGEHDLVFDGTDTENGMVHDSTTGVDPHSYIQIGAIGVEGPNSDIGEWHMNGHIAEVLVYDRLLSPDELNHVGYYLQTKYGLQGTFSPPISGTPTGDFNLDTVVDMLDFGILRDHMAAEYDGPVTYADGDIDVDGDVDLADFRQFKALFPGAVAAAEGVPEPSGLVLVLSALAGIAASVRRHGLWAW
jgi:hypothetical protein